MDTANFSDLPNHERLRAIGQMTIQAGIFMVALSTVLKHLGNLPDTPVGSPIFAEPAPHQPHNTRGYFD